MIYQTVNIILAKIYGRNLQCLDQIYMIKAMHMNDDEHR